MQKFTCNQKKLASYSAMAAAFVAIGNNTYSQVIYTNIPDELIEIGDPLFSVDFDGGGATDFLFQVAAISGGSWSFGRAFGFITTSAYAFGNSSNLAIGYAGFLPYGSALASGDVIGETQVFNLNNVNFLASIYSGNTYGEFANMTDKYLGVQFILDGNLHYGWIRLDATVSPVTLTIKDFAYNATPGEQILAGDMGDITAAEFTFANITAAVDEGAATVTGSVNISTASDCAIEVSIKSSETTATEDVDFTFDNPTLLTFTAGGPASMDFTIDITDDAIEEDNEIIGLQLQSVTGGCIISGDSSDFAIEIIDNDSPSAIEDINSNGIIYSHMNSIFINLSQEPLNNTQLQLIDEQGKLVFSSAVASKQQSFELNDIAAGIYIARILSENIATERKLYLGE